MILVFTLGSYTVQRRPDADIYRVFLGSVLIGKCYSRPSESDCAWLERQQREQTFYAYSSAPLPALSITSANGRSARYLKLKRGRPSNAKTRQDVAKALAGG